MARRKMPKTREEFEKVITSAFVAGCNHGYGVEHTANVQEQELLGAKRFLGKISDEEFYKQWEILKTE